MLQNGAFPITGALQTRHKLLRTGSFIEAHSSTGTSTSEGPVVVVLVSLSSFSVSDIVCSSSGASSYNVDADEGRGIQESEKKSGPSACRCIVAGFAGGDIYRIIRHLPKNIMIFVLYCFWTLSVFTSAGSMRILNFCL